MREKTIHILENQLHRYRQELREKQKAVVDELRIMQLQQELALVKSQLEGMP